MREDLGVVMPAAAFSGAVTTLQTAYQLVSPFIPKSSVGSIVVPSMILELVAEFFGFLSPAEFNGGAREYFHPFDAFLGLLDAVTYGFVITSVSCYKGDYTDGGAESVGKSTTQEAVTSCVMVLLADYILAATLPETELMIEVHNLHESFGRRSTVVL